MTIQNNNIDAAITNELNSILYKIPATHPILLFPVRLETKFRTITKNRKDQKQLCVRVIPDELMLDYRKNDTLSSEELHDGRFFWAQWYIASGCKKREYEAWESLCSKYTLHRASWIARQTRYCEIDKYKSNAERFSHRPYVLTKNNEEVESKFKTLKEKYALLVRREFSEGDAKNIAELLERYQTIHDELFDGIDPLVMKFEKRCQLKFEKEFPGVTKVSKIPVLRGKDKLKKRLESVYNKTFSLDDNDALTEQVSSIEIVEQACQKIYNDLSELVFDESMVEDVNSRETLFEKNVRKILTLINERIFDIEAMLNPCKWIVDYLYDNVREMALYVKRRMESLNEIYRKYPGLAKTRSRDCDVWDVDYSLLTEIQKKVDLFLSGIENKRISLNDLAEKCIKEIGIFTYAGGSSSKASVNTPECFCLPDKFLLIAESKDPQNKKVYYKMSNRVQQKKIQMGISLKKDKKGDIDVLDDLNDNKELQFREELQWMVDYDVAEKFGMAISLDIPNNVNEFRYVYVVGVRTENKNRRDDLENLFLGHNYINSGMQILGAGTPTNIIDGGVQLEEKDLQRIRYELEIEGSMDSVGKLDDIGEYDSRKISHILKTTSSINSYRENFKNIWSRVVGADSRQDYYTKIAYEKLWDVVFETINTKMLPQAGFVKSFVVNHVRARGNVASVLVDNVPYGILPMTDFATMMNFFTQSVKNRMTSEEKFVCTLLEKLSYLADFWQKTRNMDVRNAEKLHGDNVSKRFLEMAGQTPYSIDFAERTVVKSDFVPPITGKSDRFTSILNAVGYVGEIPLENICSDTKRVSEWNSAVAKALIDAGMAPENAENEAKVFTGEFLDLFTNRIDAWFSGVIDYWYTKKQKTVDSPYLGAYGWVFNLKESSRTVIKDDTKRSAIIKDMEMKNVSSGDVFYEAAKDAHFIMAPSIQHALSAVVLRSNYLQSKGKSVNQANCINLSSMRARQALRLVDGVKSGMSLSIILGTDLERYLHEAINIHKVEMDKYIYPLRQWFPQVVDIQAQDERASDYVMQVVNAEALISTFMKSWNWKGTVHEWLENNWRNVDRIKDFITQENLDKSANSKYRATLFKIFERVVDSYDALNDLLLSEGVHRLIMGDKSSYYAISSFLAKGEGNLPDPEILKIPSEHVVVSHKAGLLLPSVIEKSDKVLRTIDPALNEWVEDQLNGMDKIIFFMKTTNGEDVSYERCSLADLNISGAEYLYLSTYENTFNKYVETRWRISEGNFSNKVKFVDSAEVAGYECNGSEVSLEENKLRIDTLRSLVCRGRAMNAKDWLGDMCEDLAEADMYDMSELKDRFDESVAICCSIEKDLSKWLAKTEKNAAIDDSLIVEIYATLCSCYEAGMVNSLENIDSKVFVGDMTQTSHPVEFEDTCSAQQDLRQFVKSVDEMMNSRIEEAKSLVPSEANYESFVSAFQAISLKNAKVFPKFDYLLAVAETKKISIKNDISKAVCGEFNRYSNIGRGTFEKWQDEVADVREGMKMMNDLSMLQTAMDLPANNVSVIQTSIQEQTFDSAICGVDSDCWMGVQVPKEELLRDADSLVLYNTSTFRSSVSSYSGFVFDSWIEYIPYEKHDAGFAFHNDWPDNEAPQAMIVAWNPKLPLLKNTNDGSWATQTFVDILPTTRFMMMNRAVDPDYVFGDPNLSMFTFLPQFKA